MARLINLVLIFLFTTPFLNGQDLYTIPVKSFEGQKMDLTIYKGKKILFYVLPLSGTDSNFIQLVSFQKKISEKIQIIGIPAVEEGYKESDHKKIKELYADNNINIIITEEMMVKKSSGVQQSALMWWLTNKEGNQHFNSDVKGIGQKFFVDETGELYAVIGPQFSLNAAIIEKILNK